MDLLPFALRPDAAASHALSHPHRAPAMPTVRVDANQCSRAGSSVTSTTAIAANRAATCAATPAHQELPRAADVAVITSASRD